LVLQDKNTLWLGGYGSLYRITHDDSAVTHVQTYTPETFGGDNVLALLYDRRGWLWVGTDKGLSIFDGQRWRLITTSDGLIGNDVNQGALFQDTDGTIWVGTSRGLSHIRNPERLFDIRPLRPFINEITLGGRPIEGQVPTYTTAPLTIDAGTLDYQDDADIRFRYKLDGVDANYGETSTGSIRYAFLPPGEHTFTLFAVNPRTHQTSPPITTTFTMPWPWYNRWPIIALYAVGAVLIGYSGVRWRERYTRRRQADLEAKIEQKTAELAFQANHDELTGLLNRRAIQSALKQALDAETSATPVCIGLFDVDHFKQINDLNGHLVGDEVLIELGRRLKAVTRDMESAGRYGGEEFLVIIQAAPETGLRRLATIRKAITEPAFKLTPGDARVTASAGVAWRLHPHNTVQDVLEYADIALYRAKHEGRNRLCVSKHLQQALEANFHTRKEDA